MQRSADRLSVFALALILHSAVHYVLGAPPDGRTTWLAWALAKTRQLVALPPRLRVFAPFAVALAIVRGAALLERSRPAGGGRAISLLIQAALLAASFDLWRGLRAGGAVQRQLADAPVDSAGRPAAALDSERIEAEIGRLANAPSESVVGPWAAYAMFDLSGALTYAAVESLGGPMAGPGSEGPLTGLLDPGRRLVSVRRGRDAIAAAATLAARGRSDLQALELEELALGSETPIPVTAMSVALDRRSSWNGRAVGWHRPAPDLDDLSRARRLHLKALGLLALTAAGVSAIGNLFRPPPRAEEPQWDD